MKDIIVIDFETNGLDRVTSEFHELGSVLIDGKTFEIIDEFETQVKIYHPERSSKQAFSLSDITLDMVMQRNKTCEEGIKEFHEHYFGNNKRDIKSVHFASWNITFDWMFMLRGYRKVGMNDVLYEFDHHQIDLWTMYDIYRKLLGKTDYLYGVQQALRELGFEKEANSYSHRALDDCKKEAMVLQSVYKSISNV